MKIADLTDAQRPYAIKFARDFLDALPEGWDKTDESSNGVMAIAMGVAYAKSLFEPPLKSVDASIKG